MSLKKSVRVFVDFVIIPTRLLFQMQGESSGGEFLRTCIQVQKEKEFCRRLFTSSIKRAFSRLSRVVEANKCAKKCAARAELWFC